MKKVFVIVPSDYDWQEPIAAFSSEEKAITYTKEQVEKRFRNKIFTKHYCICELYVE